MYRTIAAPTILSGTPEERIVLAYILTWKETRQLLVQPTNLTSWQGIAVRIAETIKPDVRYSYVPTRGSTTFYSELEYLSIRGIRLNRDQRYTTLPNHMAELGVWHFDKVTAAALFDMA